MLKKIILSALILSSSAYAQDFPVVCRGKYFNTYCQQGIDPLNVAYKIKASPQFYVHEDSSVKIFRGGSPKEVLAENIDAVFKEVSEILDMHLYSFHGDIKIFSTKDGLKKAFLDIANTELKSDSFYHYEQNTIYISEQDLRVGILAHEIAHAIISRYFVVPPPAKVQEVLSGYVEYNINKKFSQ
ncbi:MAG: hypothetical protein PHQ54_02505 [Candidatus Omnitrophica bacterium]|nr:hypothetical protein [Candidatus Omnitrophota bacterium]